MKKLFTTIAIYIFFWLLLFATESNANSITQMSIDVYLNSDGSANITETWNAKVTEGTEAYKQVPDLGKYEVSNFTVSDDSGRIYETLQDWDAKATFSEKAYKCGINDIDDGVELCWGISEKGNRKYVIKYTVSNIVREYSDGVQGLYFDFFECQQTVKDVSINIHSDSSLSKGNTAIWCFGNKGEIHNETNEIQFNSCGTVNVGEYIVVLVRFNNRIFNIQNTEDESFDEIYESAMKNATKAEKNSFFSEKSYIIMCMVSAFLPIILVIIFSVVRNINYSKKKVDYERKEVYGSTGKNIQKKHIDYYRDIPCNSNILKVYWIATKYNLIREEDLKKGIIGAILLKWIKDNKITIKEEEKSIFSFKYINYQIDLNKTIEFKNQIENNLLEILVSAAGNDKLLTSKKLKKYMKSNYYQLERWYNKVNYEVQGALEKKGIISKEQIETKVGSLVKHKKVTTITTYSEELKEDAIKILGFKKFLLDFSNLPEREYLEVKVWENYLIFAEVLGIADKVSEQFRKINPGFYKETQIKIDYPTIVMDHFAERSYIAMQEGIKRTNRINSSSNYSGDSRSSGGGGSSYSSGGDSGRGSSGAGFR